METNEKNRWSNFFHSDNGILLLLAAVKLLVHFYVNLFSAYGYFRDELYYIACSDHPAWGYVDQPPLSIAVLWLSRMLFGDSLFALRLLPAVAGAIVVFMAGLMARELGGKRYAQILAACAVISSPLMLGMGGYYSMNSLDILLWTMALYLIVIIINRGAQKHWILLGIVLGLGLLNKISVLWLGAGLAAGLLFTQHRKMLLKPGAWIALCIALALFLPHIVWQVKYDFPTLEFMKNATSDKYVAVTPWQLFTGQIDEMNPFLLPLWIAGLFYIFISRSVKQFRILGIIYLTVFLILAANGHSKAEYLGPMFPMLFALGALAVEKFFLRFNWTWLRTATIAVIFLSGMLVAPFAITLLPVEDYIAYAQRLGKAPSTSEKKEIGRLPQHFADRFGWEKMTAAVAHAYGSLTPEEKAKCVIYCNNYGEAGAIDFFSDKYGLPKTISGHNNYWLWGPRDATGEVVIRLGGSMERMKESYREVIQAGVFQDDYCMPYENNMPVWICKGRFASLKDDWPDFKHYD